MYFNRKGAKQTNWRMIKKGKHFLFGCSLVLALGATTTVAASDVAVAENTSVTSEPEVTLTEVSSSDVGTKEAANPVVVVETEVVAPAEEVVKPAASSEEKVEEKATDKEEQPKTSSSEAEKPVASVEEVKPKAEVTAAEPKVVNNSAESTAAPQTEAKSVAQADLSKNKEKIIRGLEKLKELPNANREEYAKLIEAATSIEQLQNLQSQANQANALLYLERTRAQREAAANSNVSQGTAFRKVTTDLYKAALAEIKGGLPNLNSERFNITQLNSTS